MGQGVDGFGDVIDKGGAVHQVLQGVAGEEAFGENQQVSLAVLLAQGENVPEAACEVTHSRVKLAEDEVEGGLALCLHDEPFSYRQADRLWLFGHNPQ